VPALPASPPLGVPISRVGHWTLTAARAASDYRTWLPLTAGQMRRLGVDSLPIALFIAVFTGIVLALLSSYTFTGAVPLYFVGALVGKTIMMELGPVLTGLALAGRVGANIAAEIGTMRVTDQIDALTTLSTNPYRYLVVPRLIAGLTMLPILVFIADIIGVFGGFLVSTYKLGFNASSYIQRSVDFLQTQDVVAGLAKAAVFGFIVTLMGCYNGYHSRGGAQGVGAATTYAVVSASILILVFDYVLTEAFFAR